MDKERFDAITRALGDRRSRRGALALAAGAVGLAATGAEAKRIRPTKTVAACAGAGTRTCATSLAQKGANLSDCNYRNADLHGRILTGVNASKANFSGANLQGVNFKGAGLSLACFSGARLNKANLSGTNLTNADLSRADLRGADLRLAQVSGTIMSGILTDCSTYMPDGSKGC